MVSFVQPDCTYKKGSYSLSGTGLQFSSDGPTVRDAIKALKAARPNTRVIVAVGGATYTNFKGMNTQCIKDLVDDFGFDGADLDWGERPGVGGGQRALTAPVRSLGPCTPVLPLVPASTCTT